MTSSYATPMIDAWATPGQTARRTIRTLMVQGIPFNAGDGHNNGLMRLCEMPWGDGPREMPVGEALFRLDWWLALGGTMGDIANPDCAWTPWALMGRANAVHRSRLVARGAHKTNLANLFSNSHQLVPGRARGKLTQ